MIESALSNILFKRSDSSNHCNYLKLGQNRVQPNYIGYNFGHHKHVAIQLRTEYDPNSTFGKIQRACEIPERACLGRQLNIF